MKDYTVYDYQTLVDRMTDILKDKEGWGDGYQSSTGQTLIQLMADVTDHLHYMLERRTIENFLDTAKLRSSVIARASELGYRHQRIQGHRGFLTLTLTSDAVGEVTIPALTELKEAEGERRFYTTESVTIPGGSRTVDVPVAEGVLINRTFNFPEEQVGFQDYSNIDENSFFVFSEGVEYEDITLGDNAIKGSLSFAGPDDRVYDIKYDVNGLYVVFGDDVFGFKPKAPVTVMYAQIDQMLDPIMSIGRDFIFDSEIVDFQYPDVVYEYTLWNSSPITGGEVEESLIDIKNRAVDYHKSNNRAVTNDDYSYWVTKSGIESIVDARAFGEEEINTFIYNANNVFITYATELGTALTQAEYLKLREFIDTLKMSQAHIVINQARNIGLRLNMDIKKTPKIPFSNQQAYKTITDYLKNYFKTRKGSIGKPFHLTDLIDDMYDIRIERGGVSYPLVDYMKVDSDVVIPFDFKPKTSEVLVTLASYYEPQAGDEWVLVVGNLVCRVTVEAGMSVVEILTKMRDVVEEITPYSAKVELSGIALDPFGNTIPVEINPRVGYHLLIGLDTPYFNPVDHVKPAEIGSAVIDVASSAPAVTFHHYYYSSRAGRRPMIPMRLGTTISMTAPSDSDVNVYIRSNALDPDTESVYGFIPAGEDFSITYYDEHALIFEYVSDSYEDVVVEIVYPDYDGIFYGLRIKAVDNIGTFDVITTSGDLADLTSTYVDIQLPKPDYSEVSRPESLVMKGTVKVTDAQGVPVLIDSGYGDLLHVNTKAFSGGKINYDSAVVTLPRTLPAVEPENKYLIIYEQDSYGNLAIGSKEVIQLIAPKPTMDSTEFSISTLKVK